MPVDDGNLEKDPLRNPEIREALEAPMKRARLINDGVDILDDIVKVIFDAKEAA